MEIKKGYYSRENGTHILEVVGFHESGDPMCNWIFSDGGGFRYHKYEFSKEMTFVDKTEVDKLERHTCGRRAGVPFRTTIENPDVWYIRDSIRKCSFCGSIHSMDLIAVIKEEGVSVIEPSTKSYKWYVNSTKGHLKYYRQHDTTEFMLAITKIMK